MNMHKTNRSIKNLN